MQWLNCVLVNSLWLVAVIWSENLTPPLSLLTNKSKVLFTNKLTVLTIIKTKRLKMTSLKMSKIKLIKRLSIITLYPQFYCMMQNITTFTLITKILPISEFSPQSSHRFLHINIYIFKVPVHFVKRLVTLKTTSLLYSLTSLHTICKFNLCILVLKSLKL
jgi:hypothetical protein